METLKGKGRHLAVLALGLLLIKGLWFSASAVIPQLGGVWQLDGNQRAWLTMSVQLGFVAGALISAVLNLADRYDLTRLLFVSALIATMANAAIPLLRADYSATLALRFLTGLGIAGVYPPGMKLVATWCKEDRGFGIGLLVAALTFGCSLPHLLNALPQAGGMPPWRDVLKGASAIALIGAIIVAILFKPGPYLAGKAPFDWRHAVDGLRERPTRLANFGYLGHMWELYAMWGLGPDIFNKQFYPGRLVHARCPTGGFRNSRSRGLGRFNGGDICRSAGAHPHHQSESDGIRSLLYADRFFVRPPIAFNHTLPDLGGCRSSGFGSVQCCGQRVVRSALYRDSSHRADQSRLFALYDHHMAHSFTA
jgi:MFS family permease